MMMCRSGLSKFHLKGIDMKLAVLVCLALLAFAANSLFARLALAEGASDALSFSIVRLVSAAVIL